MSAAWAAWQRFWFQPRSVAPLVLVRIAFGILVTLWAVSLLPDAAAFFGDRGVLPQAPPRAGGWTVFDLWGGDAAAVTVVAALALAGVMLAFGLWTRAAAVAIFVAFVSLGERNPFVGNAGDGLIRTLALFVALAPAGAAVSLDARRRRAGGGGFPRRPPWALRLIQVQVSLIYLATVWAKLRGATWPDGTAVAYAFRLEDLARFPVPDVGSSQALTHLLTYGVLAAEAAIGVLIWSRRLRPWVLLLGVCLHLGIEYRLRVGFFSWAILVAYLSFVPERTAERLLQSRRWRAGGSTRSWPSSASSSRAPARLRP